MVYFGPSKGCETCKRRRKKCDETRPSCMRCTTAKRTCGGYEDSNTFIVQQYDSQNGGLAPFKSIARKCSLPVQDRPSTTAASTRSDVPKEVSDEESDRLALSAFFYDYCVISMNPALSRGFLSGLEKSLHRIGLDSNLAKACKLVAFANHGITLNRPTLSRRAEAMYPELVATLAVLIQKSASSTVNEEALLIAMLLGLYEIIVADRSRPGIHKIHAAGIAAMLRVKNDPLHLLRIMQHGKPLMLGPTFQKTDRGFFAAPNSKPIDQTLDSLIIQLGHVWQSGRSLLAASPVLPDLVCKLRQEALLLDQKFGRWEEVQEDEFRPSSIGRVDEKAFSFDYEAAYWPGRVDTYFDPYVAAVWNTYRVSRLLLIELIFDMSTTIGNSQDHDREHDTVLHLLEDLLASIPYHLVGDLHIFYRELGNEKSTVNPGTAVSGLLLMQPLHVVSHLSIVNPWVRNYLKRCLEWIGQHMGIQQASILAELPSFDLGYLFGSSMITLVGLLI